MRILALVCGRLLGGFFLAVTVALHGAGVPAGLPASEPEGLPLAEVYHQATLGSIGTFSSVVEDTRGFIYIGDRGRLWEFDGATARLIEASERMDTRVLIQDLDGAVLSGNADEFRRVRTLASGKHQVEAVPVADDKTLSKINAIHPTRDRVFIVGEHNVGVWDRRTPIRTHDNPARTFTSFVWRGLLDGAVSTAGDGAL